MAAKTDDDGNGMRVPCEATAQIGRRRREAAALAALVVVLAVLWVAIFLSTTGIWGEYRPVSTEIQDPPPPPTILVPSLTIDEAWEIVEHAASEGESAYGFR